MNKLRSVLLSDIISSREMFNRKYSQCYNSLKAIIELEKKEKTQKLPKSIFDDFNKITDKMNNLNEKVANIPLLILEQYFFRNSKDLNKYIYIEYNEGTKRYEADNVYASDLYLILEKFYLEIYYIAIAIADYYSLEVKLKDSSEISEENYL